MTSPPALSLDALGSPTRREILRKLKSGPQTVGEIAKDLPISRPATSKHLKLLMGAQLVDYETRGRENFYCINRIGFEQARAGLEEFWNESLLSIKELAESRVAKGKRL